MGDTTGIILVEMYKLKETYFMSVSIKGGIQLWMKSTAESRE